MTFWYWIRTQIKTCPCESLILLNVIDKAWSSMARYFIQGWKLRMPNYAQRWTYGNTHSPSCLVVTRNTIWSFLSEFWYRDKFASTRSSFALICLRVVEKKSAEIWNNVRTVNTDRTSWYRSFALTHLCPAPHVCVSESGKHWFR